MKITLEAIKEWRKESRYRSLYVKTIEYLLSPSRFEQMAGSILSRVNRIIAVVDEGKSWYSLNMVFRKTRFSVIMNTRGSRILRFNINSEGSG